MDLPDNGCYTVANVTDLTIDNRIIGKTRYTVKIREQNVSSMRFRFKYVFYNYLCRALETPASMFVIMSGHNPNSDISNLRCFGAVRISELIRLMSSRQCKLQESSLWMPPRWVDRRPSHAPYIACSLSRLPIQSVGCNVILAFGAKTAEHLQHQKIKHTKRQMLEQVALVKEHA